MAPAVEALPEVRKDKRANSAAFKVVPQTRELRDHIRNAAAVFAKPLDRSRPFARPELMAMGEKLLADMGQPEEYLGFAMVMVGNFFWKKQFLALPFNRRILLLPHSQKHADACPPD